MSELNYPNSTNNNIPTKEYNDSNGFNNNYNYININTNKAQLENVEFEPPDHKIKWNQLFQFSYHFKQDIERIWFVVRDFDIISLFSNDGHYPCVNIKGKNTWNIGNTFKGNLYTIYPFIARVEKSLDLPEIKSIKWLFNNIKDNDFFEIKMNLFKVSEDNSTVVLRTIKFEKKTLTLEEKKKTLLILKIFQKIEGLLENEPINLLRYESGIIKGKMKDIYNILIDSNKISAIAPNNDIMPNYNLKDMKIGERTQVSIIKDKIVQTADAVLKCRETNPHWNKWRILIEISGGSPKKIPKHTSLFQLTKINNIECQLIMLTKYHEPVNCEEFQEYINKKKYLIMSIKDYFEHFHSPDD